MQEQGPSQWQHFWEVMETLQCSPSIYLTPWGLAMGSKTLCTTEAFLSSENSKPNPDSLSLKCQFCSAVPSLQTALKNFLRLFILGPVKSSWLSWYVDLSSCSKIRIYCRCFFLMCCISINSVVDWGQSEYWPTTGEEIAELTKRSCWTKSVENLSLYLHA